MAAFGTDDVRIPLPAGGALTAAVVRPGDVDIPAGGLPGMVVIHEIWGLNDDIRRIAARFADNGYVAVVPDLYSNGNKGLCLTRTMLDMAGDGKHTMEVLEAVRAWLADRDDVDATRIGVIGYCMGGGFALLFGTRGTVGVAGVNYGLVPKRRAKLTGVCPVVASYGALDRQFVAHAHRLEDHLSGLGVPHDVKLYDGAGHSFVNKDSAPGWARRLPMKAGYEEDAAEDAWARTLAFFEDHL
jgi:carboxymethylenebutenolidase